MKAIRVHAPGGPEVLSLEEVEEPVAAPGEAVVAVEAAGVNFIDVYLRTGFYPATLPATLGQEGAGTVLAIGAGVTSVRIGDRVAWQGVMGSYAERAAVPADRLVMLPPAVTTREGAALMLQGLTAHYLATATFPLAPGHTCVVHAAAGGVGLLLCQIAKARGARVIGTVSTDAKAALARAAGADVIVRYTHEDFESVARRQTGGLGVDVVYDSVGATTWERSLRCLRPRGLLVLFGQSSGPVPPIDPQILSRSGSLFLTRPTLAHYVATRSELDSRSRELFDWLGTGELRLRIDGETRFRDAAAAHRRLEGRESTGKLLLIP
ncbi:MAG: quinone oxidoreductase [Gemmatimonadaceae bacterium]